MNEIIPRRYVGLVGVGLMFMWGLALLFCVNLWKSSDSVVKAIGLLGSGITSASGIAIVLYTDSLEQKVQRLKDCSDSHAAEARFWRTQAEGMYRS